MSTTTTPKSPVEKIRQAANHVLDIAKGLPDAWGPGALIANAERILSQLEALEALSRQPAQAPDIDKIMEVVCAWRYWYADQPIQDGPVADYEEAGYVISMAGENELRARLTTLLQTSHSQPAQLVMSTDYEALYEHLCKGGEALGKSNQRPVRLYRHIDRLFITNTSAPIEVFDIGIGEAAFKSTCQRLKLEWVAPRQPAQTELDPGALAIRFHDTYERLAPSFGYETRKETRHFNPETPNGKLMVAVCSEISRSLSEPK